MTIIYMNSGVVVSDPVKSATRALDILNYFASVRRPQALKDIGDALPYPQSSMTVLLKTLTAMGYLNYDRSHRKYFPTIKVATLGEWIPEKILGGHGALHMLRDIANATSETIVLGIRNDIYLEYLYSIDSSHELRFQVSVGGVRLVHRSPLGWLLLSEMNPKDVHKILVRSFAADKALSAEPDAIPQMMDRIAAIPAEGYVYGENTPFLGGATIGMKLPIDFGGRPLALGCGGVLERMRKSKYDYLDAMQTSIASLKIDA